MLSSFVEGFGNVLVEAALVGVPFVSMSRALGVADAIVPGMTGFLCFSDTPAGFPGRFSEPLTSRPPTPRLWNDGSRTLIETQASVNSSPRWSMHLARGLDGKHVRTANERKLRLSKVTVSDSPIPIARGAAADLATTRLLRRVAGQWWVIALCAVVACLAAFVASSSRTKQYEAKSTIEVGTVDLVSIYLSDQVQVGDTDPDRLKSGAVETFNLPNVRDRAVALLAQPTPATTTRPARPATPATAKELATAVRVESKPDSSVLTVIARDANPERAKNMSNAMVEAFIAQRRETVRKKIIDAKSRITKQLANLPAAERNSPTGRPCSNACEMSA